MSRLRRELQELELIAEEQDRPADRAKVMDALAERTESHDSIRQILRDATLEASRAAVSGRDREEGTRAELLGGAGSSGGGGGGGSGGGGGAAGEGGGGGGGDGGDGNGGVKPPGNEADATALANDATAGLRRTRAMMAEELDKGQKTLAAMAESRAALRKTGSEYDGGQRAAMGAGGKLLSKLERQAVTERWGLADIALATSQGSIYYITVPK